jgi:hypothetical protein
MKLWLKISGNRSTKVAPRNDGPQQFEGDSSLSGQFVFSKSLSHNEDVIVPSSPMITHEEKKNVQPVLRTFTNAPGQSVSAEAEGGEGQDTLSPLEVSDRAEESSGNNKTKMKSRLGIRDVDILVFVKEVFEEYDKDNDGLLTACELQVIVYFSFLTPLLSKCFILHPFKTKQKSAKGGTPPFWNVLFEASNVRTHSVLSRDSEAVVRNCSNGRFDELPLHPDRARKI